MDNQDTAKENPRVLVDDLAWDLWPALPTFLIIQATGLAPVLFHRLPECKDRTEAESSFSP